ncbi:MAG: hypothetical protein H6Q86_5033 [candidate division NC10 bacterium]|nr:hypothetical protein [candidate division NC10 bacterium]
MAKKVTRSVAGPAVMRSLSAQDVKKLLHLIRNSKSVEIKVSVPMAEHQRTALSMGIDPVEAQPRHVFFFDTADQALNRAGLIVRARRLPGGTADTVVKLRPVDPAGIDAELKRSDAFKVEVDAMPDGTFMCSASYKGVTASQNVLDVTYGTKTIRSLFSKEQREFYDAHAPAGLDMNSLRIQGPILTLRTKHRPKEFARGITVELWVWKDGKHILEISTKCAPAEAFQAAVEFREYLEGHGVDLYGKQETKTRTAMEKFKADQKAGKKGSGKAGKASGKASEASRKPR